MAQLHNRPLLPNRRLRVDVELRRCPKEQHCYCIVLPNVPLFGVHMRGAKLPSCREVPHWESVLRGSVGSKGECGGV